MKAIELLKEIEWRKDLMFITQNIVNQLFDEAGTDIDTRNRINDKCDDFVLSLLQKVINQTGEIKRLVEKEADKYKRLHDTSDKVIRTDAEDLEAYLKLRKQ